MIDTTTIMEAHDAASRPYLSEEWALDWEEGEVDAWNRTHGADRLIVQAYVIDGSVWLSPQMAAFLQYQAKEMWSIYFAGGKSSKYAIGTILKIRKVNPGDI